jgi:hypothetical protein
MPTAHQIRRASQEARNARAGQAERASQATAEQPTQQGSK